MIFHSFGGGSTDGSAPYAAVIQATNGNFYGTTSTGGAYGHGTVFEITPSGTETLLHSFGSVQSPTQNFNDGVSPYAGLIQGSDGNFYGTTISGGANGNGTVFEITPAGVETVLYSFAANNFGSGITPSGGNPQSALIQDSNGNFYGTTTIGGAADYGVVFSVTPAGVETVLYSFGGVDGATPYGGLVRGSNGNFYGTTESGGANGYGTVFEITPTGVEAVLYSFGSNGGSDGAFPYASLVQGSNGNFYGTTKSGGVSKDNGTVFEITPTGVETVIYSFGGGVSDGATPLAGLVQGSNGNFFGTTSTGGNASNEDGTVFEITPAGVETVLYSFGGGSSDGAAPYASLVQGSDGNFYGTTVNGGAGTSCNQGCGIVFKLAVGGN